MQTNGYVLLAEMTNKKYLSLVAGLFEVFWAVGTLWLASISWIVQDWRKIQLALSLPCLVTLIFIVYVKKHLRKPINKYIYFKDGDSKSKGFNLSLNVESSGGDVIIKVL